MKAVCADDEVEIALGAAFEDDVNAGIGLVNSSDAIAKDRFDLAFDLAENHGGQVASSEADVTAMSCAEECVDGKARYTFPVSIFDTHLADCIALGFKLRQQAHAIGDVEACTPESDYVAA